MKLGLLRAILVACVVVLAAGCGSGAAGTSTGSTKNAAAGTPPPPPVKMTVSIGDLAPTYMKMWVAKDAGIFEKHGLNVDIQVIAGAQAVTAVIAGQIQVATGGAGETLGAQVGGANLTVLATLSPGFSGQLYAPASIKTVADLKGKKVAITNPGGTYDVVEREGLTRAGLDPEKDITLISTGSIDNAFTALLNGAVSAAPASPGIQTQKLTAAGFHSIYDLSTIPLGANFVVMQRAYVTSHRDVAQRYIDSIVEAIKKEKTDKEFTRQVWKTHAQLDDALFESVYPYYTKDSLEPALPFPKPEYMTLQLDQLTKRNEKAKGFDLTKLLDPSFMQSAADRHLDK